MRSRRKTGDAVPAICQRFDRVSKVILVPQVHPRLVSHLDGRLRCKLRRSRTDHPVFGVPTCIRIEIEEVDILNPVPGGPPRQSVPDRVIDRTLHDPPIGQIHRARGLQCRPQDWIVPHNLAQRIRMFHRKPANVVRAEFDRGCQSPLSIASSRRSAISFNAAGLASAMKSRVSSSSINA